jgi:dihydroflavonol-4-reductase
MKTFVTGAAGFIGSNVVKRLNERGLRPRVLVRPTSNRANLAQLDADIVEGDLLDSAGLRRALDGCEQLYHIAGHVSTRPSHRKRLFRDNLTATISVMDAAREVGVPRIVYLGSTTALGASDGPHPVDENVSYNLQGTKCGYFDAKRAAELAVRERVEAGLPVVSVYPGYCLGPGDLYLTSMIAIVAFVKGQLLFTTRGGMSYLDVRDAAEALVLGMERGRVGERYFAGGHNITCIQFFNLLAKETNRRPPPIVFSNPVLHVLCVIGDPLSDGSIFSRLLYHIQSRYHWYDSSKRSVNWVGRFVRWRRRCETPSPG